MSGYTLGASSRDAGGAARPVAHALGTGLRLPADVSTGMDKDVFDKFRTLIYETCGITLSENKEALVASCLYRSKSIINK